MSLGLGGVFHLMKEATLTVLCHSFLAPVCSNFASHSEAISGLPQAS
jgi:hypothetical protein